MMRDERAEILSDLILQGVVDGLSYKQIADQTETPVDTVKRHIGTIAAEARKNRDALADQQFMAHHHRTEDLWRQTKRRLDELADRQVPHDYREFTELVKTALAILIRQAALYGLDKTKLPGGQPNAFRSLDWLRDPNTSESDIHAEARRLGIHVPEEFAAMAGLST